VRITDAEADVRYRFRMRCLLVAAMSVAACGSSDGESARELGAHGQAVIKVGDPPGTAKVALATQPTGSMFLIAIAASLDNLATGAPSDDKGNAYEQLIPSGGAPPSGGSPGVRAYALFPEFGTAVWVSRPDATGGPEHVFSMAQSNEMTMFVLEIRGGRAVLATAWDQPLAGQSLTSEGVTVDRPAVLVATWWGDQASGPTPRAQPTLGKVAESARDGTPNHYAEGDIATADVAAGTYRDTWIEYPVQGAQLHLIAIEAAP
jgi:hypothetical protein